MDHKAYRLDWRVFDVIVRPVLENALADNDPSTLIELIESDIGSFKDPYEGEALSTVWLSTLENRGVHEIGDFALTRCYDPRENFGLSHAWMQIDDALPIAIRPALLGQALGPCGCVFDPGRQGSYFQSPSELKQSLKLLKRYSQHVPAEYLERLALVAADDRGLYVTF